MRLSTILAVCAALVSCGGMVTFVWQQYDGPSRPKQSIAIVRQNGTSSTVLVAVDGKSILAPIEPENRLHVEVLPGPHEVDVAAPGIGLRHAIPVRFLAEPGRVYRVEVTLSAPVQGAAEAPEPAFNGEPPLEYERWVAHAYEVERDTDTPRGVVDAPVPHPAAPAPRAARVRSPEDAGTATDVADGAAIAPEEGGRVEK
jgi:hypothetical protein